MKKGYKICPYCGNEIKELAIKCQYCKEFLNQDYSKTQNIKKSESNIDGFLKSFKSKILGKIRQNKSKYESLKLSEAFKGISNSGVVFSGSGLRIKNTQWASVFYFLFFIILSIYTVFNIPLISSKIIIPIVLLIIALFFLYRRILARNTRIELTKNNIIYDSIGFKYGLYRKHITIPYEDIKEIIVINKYGWLIDCFIIAMYIGASNLYGDYGILHSGFLLAFFGIAVPLTIRRRFYCKMYIIRKKHWDLSSFNLRSRKGKLNLEINKYLINKDFIDK